MTSVLTTIENSGLAAWVRESSSIWAYPMILFMHTVGLGFLVGLNAAIDLRILGVARRMPLAPMQTFYRVMWLAFWINAVSGTLLLIADATTKMTNPVFLIKMSFVALGVITMVLIRRYVFANPSLDLTPLAASAKVLAVTSLVFWTGAITAGRLMAYFGPVSGAPGLLNKIP